MLTFNTIAQALSANMTTIALSSVCLQTDTSLIAIKGIMSGSQLSNLSAISLNGNYVPVDLNWTLKITPIK